MERSMKFLMYHVPASCGNFADIPISAKYNVVAPMTQSLVQYAGQHIKLQII